MNNIRRPGTYKGYYYTKSELNKYGSLLLTCKITSRFGETIEHGKATALNVKKGLRYLMSKAITQCKFGHINKLKGNWEVYYSSSDSVGKDDNLRVSIINYQYVYDTFKGLYKFKTFNVKGKKYTQSFIKKNNKYVFSERTKTKYTKKKIQKVQEDYKL